MCTTVTLWRLYEYLLMSIVMVIARDVFQARLAGLFTHLFYVLDYIDDISIIEYRTFDKHLEYVNEVIDILCNLGIQVNLAKCIWAKYEIEYISVILTTKGVKSQPKKIKKIQAIVLPKNKKQLRQLISTIYHYKDMYDHRAHILQPLTSMVGTNLNEFGKRSSNQRSTRSNRSWREIQCYLYLITRYFNIFTDASD